MVYAQKNEVSPDGSDLGVIIVGGGAATRFASDRNKLLCDLQGLPVVCHTLRTFLALVPPSRLVMVVPAGQEAAFRQAFKKGGLDEAAINCVAGGRRRQDSVLNGLRQLSVEATIVAVQDAARPWTSVKLVHACVKSARERGSGVAARRIIDTVKRADPEGRVEQTLDRELLWATETPQVFQRAQLEAGYRQATASGLTMTDDAQAVELAGFPVFLVEHSGRNPKITHVSDLPG